MFADTGLLSPGWARTGVDALLDDRAWLRAMITTEVALARAQARLGVVPESAAETIAAAADPDAFDWPGLVEGVHATGNPVVAFVSQLTAIVRAADTEAPATGLSAADHVHRGSTSQDVLDTATMLLCRDALRRLRTDLLATAAALAALAGRHRDTPMAGRTLTQHAVPITFGLKAAGWLAQVLDAVERIEAVLDGGLPVSLGGAAGTLAAYGEFADGDPLDLVEPFAAELGLAPQALPWHSSRTPIADVASVLAFASGALGRLAADVAVLSRTEIGEVAEPAEPGRGASSAMPQKRNPVHATAILTAARQVPALVSVLHQCLVVEDERSAGGWHAEWQPLREALRLVLGAARNAAALTAGLRAFPDRMRENLALTGGAVVSERLGARLTPVLGKVETKRLLTEATAATSGRPDELPDWLHTRLAGAGPDLDALRALCDPRGYTGASGALVDRAVERWRAVGERG
ncbi:3-carboxy-cis,cis-muconate cycloisomerase [Actinosynnema pretiosum]|uniref:3-carboxy-cis,cis-muconate cycloisomerase n=1 Tax=Actinosynnema pretiosum TaxID=42197 RepID=A0A290Z9W6_9PSEU|nr:3-carboxy-cis,cis-muconate cycloisomerase [Actinosynnema pretiosum]ATE55831.1 3-carboxy-cis,cis-muconate cycloisomerase [Actinosynnema pretiosum]